MAETISIFAIIISMFTFWWTSIRNPKKLIVINVKGSGNDFMPEFALINGSKKDLLITKLQCSFSNDDKKSDFTPAQRLEFKESNDFVLKSESAFHCSVKFTEPFIETFVVTGNPDESHNKTFYMHTMYINISWVEMCGKSHTRTIKFLQYGFDKNGDIRQYKPLEKSIELYKTT